MMSQSAVCAAEAFSRPTAHAEGDTVNTQSGTQKRTLRLTAVQEAKLCVFCV